VVAGRCFAVLGVLGDNSMTWGSRDGAGVEVGADASWDAFLRRVATRVGRQQLDVARSDRLGEVLDDFEIFALELELRDVRLLATPPPLDLHQSTFADVEYWLDAR
jgi:hypothetical protein